MWSPTAGVTLLPGASLPSSPPMPRRGRTRGFYAKCTLVEAPYRGLCNGLYRGVFSGLLRGIQVV